MVHEYLNEIGVPSDHVAIYGTTRSAKETFNNADTEIDFKTMVDELGLDCDEIENEPENEEDSLEEQERVNKLDETYRKQREEHGFDERETYELYFTSATWLYEHLKFYLDRASRVIDLTGITVTIPVLKEIQESQKEYIDYGQRLGKIAKAVYTTVEEEHSLEDSICLMCSYLEQYLRGEVDSKDKLGAFQNRGQRLELLEGAFAILAKTIVYIYW